MIWIRDAGKELQATQVRWIGSAGCEVDIAGVTYRLTAGSPHVVWDKGSITLSKPSVIQNGKLLVSAELTKELRPLSRIPRRLQNKTARIQK
jgi:hypothetical protein